MLNQFIKTLRIMGLKRQARAAYLEARYAGVQYSCGRDLTDHIQGGRITRAEQRFNRALDALAALGEDVPSFRFAARGPSHV